MMCCTHCSLYSLQQGQRNFFGWRFCLKFILGGIKYTKRPFLNNYEYRAYIYRIYVDIIGQIIFYFFGEIDDNFFRVNYLCLLQTFWHLGKFVNTV